jgi:hypothetical protein
VVHGVVHEEVLGNSLFYFILIRLHHFAPLFFSIAFCLLILRKNNLGASSPKVIDPPTSQNWKKNPLSQVTPSMDQATSQREKSSLHFTSDMWPKCGTNFLKIKSKKVILEVLSSQK